MRSNVTGLRGVIASLLAVSVLANGCAASVEGESPTAMAAELRHGGTVSVMLDLGDGELKEVRIRRRAGRVFAQVGGQTQEGPRFKEEVRFDDGVYRFESTDGHTAFVTPVDDYAIAVSYRGRVFLAADPRLVRMFGEEGPRATIDPVTGGLILAGIIVGGFLVWKWLENQAEASRNCYERMGHLLEFYACPTGTCPQFIAGQSNHASGSGENAEAEGEEHCLIQCVPCSEGRNPGNPDGVLEPPEPLPAP